MGADLRFLRSADGMHRDFEAEHWAQGSPNDGSTGAEWDVPAGAVTAEIRSSVAAFCAPVAEEALDISGETFNGHYIPANGTSGKFTVVGKAKVSIKAATGNLAIVTVRWGGKQG